MKLGRFKVTKRFYIVILTAVFLYVAVLGIGQFKEYSRLQEEIAGVDEEIADANREKDALEYTIQYADTDEYIESVVRDRLGWVKQGETRYDFVD